METSRGRIFFLGEHIRSLRSRFRGKASDKIGFPTINFNWPGSKVIPSNGVYAVRIGSEKSGSLADGVANLGLNPTVESNRVEPVLEVNVIDSEKVPGGDSFVVEFYEFIRAEMKFESVDKLTEQIAKDREKARSILEKS